MRWLTISLTLAAASLGAESGAVEFAIQVDEQYRYVEAGPLVDDQWPGIETGLSSKAAQVLAVHVGKPASFNSRPMLGTYKRVGDRLRFEPRFEFRPGLPYVVRFTRPSAPSRTESPRVESLAFTRPALSTAKQHRVAAVYPSSGRLPENLLKFYIHFSGPMSRGEAYRRVRLVGGEGDVDLPFLELGEELWDPEGCRLTLLFDPGRIKRGLKPREDAGQILTAGNKYVLTIDAGWPDARGIPLAEDHQKAFVVTPADYRQPDVSEWRLDIPPQGTRRPLVVTFSESMDHAMSNRVLSVVGPGDEAVVGTVTVQRDETQWAFQPDGSWLAGDYRLTFDAALEDVAGNSIGRAFEVKEDANPQPVVRELSFAISEVPTSFER